MPWRICVPSFAGKKANGKATGAKTTPHLAHLRDAYPRCLHHLRNVFPVSHDEGREHEERFRFRSLVVTTLPKLAPSSTASRLDSADPQQHDPAEGEQRCSFSLIAPPR